MTVAVNKASSELQSRHVTREAAHQSLDALYDQLDGETIDGVQFNASAWRFFSETFGDVVAAYLHGQALMLAEDDDEYRDMAPGLGRLQDRYDMALLISLINSAKGILPQNFSSGAVITDLVLTLTARGAPTKLRSNNANPNKWVKEAVRRYFVLGVIHRSQVESVAAWKLAEQVTDGRMGENAWKKWRNAIPAEERDSVRVAAQTGKRLAGFSTDDASLLEFYRKGLGEAPPRPR